jgi:hypothetical protein
LPTDTLLLKMRATCWSDTGTILERIRLPALVVQPEADRLTDATALSVEEDGTLILDSPLGMWSTSTGRPPEDPDDDPLRNEEVSR